MPTANFKINKNNSPTITFNAGTSSGTDLIYSWDFGDGDNGTGKTPSHEYKHAETFTVTLTVTEPDGDFATKSREVVIDAVPAPTPCVVTEQEDCLDGD